MPGSVPVSFMLSGVIVLCLIAGLLTALLWRLVRSSGTFAGNFAKAAVGAAVFYLLTILWPLLVALWHQLPF